MKPDLLRRTFLKAPVPDISKAVLHLVYEDILQAAVMLDDRKMQVIFKLNVCCVFFGIFLTVKALSGFFLGSRVSFQVIHTFSGSVCDSCSEMPVERHGEFSGWELKEKFLFNRWESTLVANAKLFLLSTPCSSNMCVKVCWHWKLSFIESFLGTSCLEALNQKG